MDILELQRRAIAIPEPLHTGEWATLAFRPDIASQQEFIVGVAAAIDGDATPHIKWLPSFAKLSALYGDAITASDVAELLNGSELAINSSFRRSLSGLDTGTPHIRVNHCGYISCHDVERELVAILKRQAGAIWQEIPPREKAMDDDWAYGVMRDALGSILKQRDIFVTGRSLSIAGKTLEVGLDTGTSYGNIISARYATFSTIEKHIHHSMLAVSRAHRLTNRQTAPALFVILPEMTSSVESATARKTAELMEIIGETGIMQFCEKEPVALAEKVSEWVGQGRKSGINRVLKKSEISCQRNVRGKH